MLRNSNVRKPIQNPEFPMLVPAENFFKGNLIYILKN